MKRVVVTGLGTVNSLGNCVDSFWQGLISCRSGIKAIKLFDSSRSEIKIAGEVDNFEPTSFLDPKEVKKNSRCTQFAIAASKEAILDSGLDLKGDTSRYGCSIGVGIGAIQRISETSQMLLTKTPKRVSPFFIPYVIANMASGNTATYFGLKGPNMCTTTACASGTHGIGEALLYIQNGLADVMVCGGSESAISELTIAGFANMKALSKRNDDPEKASRPFDKDRDGFVLSEGSGILVLESLEHAKKRDAKIYCELVGYGMSCDAYHLTSPAPRGRGAQRCMKEALNYAKINKESIDYINAHGTSTPHNDISESQAIEDLFKDHAQKLFISSTKSMIGHCLGASGGVEAIVLAKSIVHNLIHPTKNLDNQDPECKLNYVPNEPIEKQITYAISNSFGFGGTNASIVFKKFDK